MRLKFTGTNGSLGLEHGRVYHVRIYSESNRIWLAINRNSFFDIISCCYDSPQGFAKNWSL